MTDIGWDFNKNDVLIQNGDFGKSTDPSRQNAALILLKQATNISAPEWGMGYEGFYFNSTYDYALATATGAKQQVENDGAIKCSVTVTPIVNGQYQIDIAAKYPE